MPPPLLSNLPTNIVEIAHYGLTGMVNNAVDHSDGERLSITASIEDGVASLGVSDDGVGIFRKIAAALALPDDRLAPLELAKGKFTTDPQRHPGEGVFFTSKIFDVFEIVSRGLTFDHRSGTDKNVPLEAHPGRTRSGTTIITSIAADSTRTLEQVFAAFSSGPDDYGFAKTIVPVKLARIGDESLMSRSQAKRPLQRVGRFQHVVLDFAGVAVIGPAFADQVFRVFANERPDIELIAIHATPEVQQTIRRAEIARDEQSRGEQRT
ncbi:MAG TPA: DUF4325 domain-containing protein [Rhodanobacteraceae bacterium]|nr:DUF4325 domain-containing protein [Rhodanobacteraceae bacterium]